MLEILEKKSFKRCFENFFKDSEILIFQDFSRIILEVLSKIFLGSFKNFFQIFFRYFITCSSFFNYHKIFFLKEFLKVILDELFEKFPEKLVQFIEKLPAMFLKEVPKELLEQLRTPREIPLEKSLHTEFGGINVGNLQGIPGGFSSSRYSLKFSRNSFRYSAGNYFRSDRSRY